MYANTAKTGKIPSFISSAIEQENKRYSTDKLWDEAILEAEIELFPFFLAPPQVRVKPELLPEYIPGTWRDLLRVADEPDEPEKEFPLWTARCKKCGWQNTSGFHAEDEVEAGIIANLTHGCCAYDAPPLAVARIEADCNPLKYAPSEPVAIPCRNTGEEKVIAENGETICPIGNIEIQENSNYDFFCYAIHKDPDSDNKINLFTVIEYDELDEDDILETIDLDG